MRLSHKTAIMKAVVHVQMHKKIPTIALVGSVGFFMSDGLCLGIRLNTAWAFPLSL